MTYSGNLAIKVQLKSLDKQTELEVRSQFSNQLGLMSKQLRRTFKRVYKTTKQIPIMCKQLENGLMVFILAHNSKIDKTLSIVVYGNSSYLTSNLVFTNKRSIKYLVLDGLTVPLVDFIIFKPSRSNQILNQSKLVVS